MANLFHPHGAYLLGATFLGQADDLQVDQNVDELTHYATGDPMPGFVGSKKTEPEFRIDTNDLSTVLTLVAAGDENFVRSLAAGNADLMFRQSKNQSTREAVGASKHVIYRMIQSAMFFWDSFEVSQDNEAKINTRIVAAYKTGQPTITPLKLQTIPASPAVTKLYTVGKCFINGTALNRIKKVNWNNNPTVEKEAADGEGQPSHVCIGKTKPTVQIDTQELEQTQAFGDEGLTLDGTNGLVVYLRRRLQGKINYPDASPVHLKLQATTGGVMWGRTSGEKAVAQVNVALQRPSAGGVVWTITQDVAIP
jgi:hypothetical protein